MSHLLKCSKNQEITPSHFPHTPRPSIAFCLPCTSLPGQTPPHSPTPSSDVTSFLKNSMCSSGILCISSITIFAFHDNYFWVCLPNKGGNCLIHFSTYSRPSAQHLSQSWSTVNGSELVLSEAVSRLNICVSVFCFLLTLGQVT